jgi:hypothetical protein
MDGSPNMKESDVEKVGGSVDSGRVKRAGFGTKTIVGHCGSKTEPGKCFLSLGYTLHRNCKKKKN